MEHPSRGKEHKAVGNRCDVHGSGMRERVDPELPPVPNLPAEERGPVAGGTTVWAD